MSGRPAAGGGQPIIQYWDAEEPPAEVDALMATFAAHDHGMPHLVFDRRTAGELIAERFGERHAEAFWSCAVPAMQADYFRYCAVHALGGVYVDADYGFRRDLRPLLEAEGQLFERAPHGPTLNGLFAFRSPRHPFLALAIEMATRNIEKRVSDNVALVTGPAIFTGLRRLQQSGSIEALRPPYKAIRPAWRPDLDACWAELVDSLAGAVAACWPIAAALAGVHVSSNLEIPAWVRHSEAEPAYKGEDSYWANWRGSIFHPPGVGEPG